MHTSGVSLVPKRDKARPLLSILGVFLILSGGGNLLAQESDTPRNQSEPSASNSGSDTTEVKNSQSSETSAKPQYDKSAVEELIRRLQEREGEVFRIEVDFTVRNGSVKPTGGVSRADGEAFVMACLNADFLENPETPSAQMHIARDFETAAAHLRIGDREKTYPIFKEFLYDGEIQTTFVAVEDNTQIKATVDRSFSDDLKLCNLAHPRPDILALTPVGFRPLSAIIREAIDSKFDVGHPAITCSVVDDSAVCVFDYLNPIMDPVHGQALDLQWYRVFFAQSESDTHPVRIDRLDVSRNLDIPMHSYLLEDWKDVNGRLFPHKIRCFNFLQGGCLATAAEVNGVKFNEDVEIPEVLAVPPGTPVRDKIANRMVRQGREGSEIDKEVQATIDEVNQQKSSSWSSRQLLFTFNCVGIAMIVVIIAVRRFGKRSK